MSRAKRTFAMLGVTALASAGLMTAFAPAASAAPLPAGCTAEYVTTSPADTEAKAGVRTTGDTMQLNVNEAPAGACAGVMVNNTISVVVTKADSSLTSADDIVLEVQTGAGPWERIALSGPPSGGNGTYTGTWGTAAGFSLLSANGISNQTRFTAPAGVYDVDIALNDVATGPTGVVKDMGPFTVYAAPVVTAADRSVAIGGTTNPVVSTVSGNATNPQSTFTYAPSSTLPTGVVLNSDGTISVSSSASPGSWSGTIRATDTVGQTGVSNPFKLTINAAATPTITGDADMWAVAGKAFTNSSVSASGGTPPYTFDWDLDPAVGLSINPDTGAITGTIGSYAFDADVEIAVIDDADEVATYTTTMHILGFNLAGSSLSGGIVTCQVGSPFSLSFTPIGLGGHAYAFSSATPVSNSGMTLTADGKLTGTPTNCDFMSYTYTLTDTADGRVYSRTFSDTNLDTDVQPVPPTNTGQKPLADSGSTRTVAFAGIGLAALAMGLAAYFISRRLREDVHAIV